ncbi:hypothetical protein [Medusavirus stheno T3]|uniref:Uncharacterized protein n=1 Tax=Medusavirus stheno T3 TaxID=3069717 RepID=A0A7S7YEE6_9VIRU|nr:hypothetical protein QKU73_gp072 [Acanthamoeba castellanii medusavirus]QPB44253.1 hypothetical protein [Medusavirus stheno T3]
MRSITDIISDTHYFDAEDNKHCVHANHVLSRLRRYLSPLELTAFASTNRAIKKVFVEWITSSPDQSLLPPPSTPADNQSTSTIPQSTNPPRSEIDPSVVSERISSEDIHTAIINMTAPADSNAAEALRQWMNLTVRINAEEQPAHADVLHRLERLVQYVCCDSLSAVDVKIGDPLVQEMQTELGHCFRACGGPNTKHSLILKETVRQICDARNLAIFDLDSDGGAVTIPAVFYTTRSGIFLPDQKRGLHDERVHSVAAAREVNVFDQMGAPCNATPFGLVDDEAAYIARPFGRALKSKVRPTPETVTGKDLLPRPLGELVHTRPAPREILRTSTIIPTTEKIKPFILAHLEDQGIASTSDNIGSVPLAMYPLEWLSVTTVASTNPSLVRLPPVLGESEEEPSASQAAELPSPASVSVMLDPFRGRQPVSLHLYGVKTRGVLDNYPAVVVSTVRMPPKELIPVAAIRKRFQAAIDAGLRYASRLWENALVHASATDDSEMGGAPAPNYAFIGLRLGYESDTDADLVIEKRSKMGHFLAPSVSNIVASFASDDMVYNVGRLHLETLAHTPCSSSVYFKADDGPSHYLPGSIDVTRATRKAGIKDYGNLHDACEFAINYLSVIRTFFRDATNNAAKALAYECSNKPTAASLPCVPIAEDFERVQDELVSFIRGQSSIAPKAEMPPPVAPSTKRKAPEHTPAPSRRRTKKQRVLSEEEAECERQIQRLKRKRSVSPPRPKKKKVRRGQKRGIEELAEEDRGKYCSAEGYDDRFNDVKKAAIPVPLPINLKSRRAFDKDEPPTVPKFCVFDAQRMRRFVVQLGIPGKVLRDGHTRKSEMDRKELIAAYINWVCEREEKNPLFGDDEFDGNHDIYTEVAAEMEQRIDKALKTYRSVILSREDERLSSDSDDEDEDEESEEEEEEKRPPPPKKTHKAKNKDDYYNDEDLADDDDEEE